MAVANGDNAAPSLELDVKPPENIVIPPATVRAHVGKTADFIFRRGDQLLQTLKQRIANESKSQITTLKLWLCKLADPLSPGRL